MKPFQFFIVDKMPDLAPSRSVSNQIQLTFSGEEEDVKTTITMKMKNYEGNLSLLRIVSGVKHKTVGYIKTLIDSKKIKIDFIEYLQPVDFPAYYDNEKKLIMFQAPKKVCRGVLSHLKASPCGIDLVEMKVDFSKLFQLCSEYVGAWFRSVSARVRAAGLSGNQIQDDVIFKNLSEVASLSNVTIPWLFRGVEHHVMITNRAGIVLTQYYGENIGLELQLVMDVYEKLLKEVWYKREPSDDVEIED